jgi:hypothetical protein
MRFEPTMHVLAQGTNSNAYDVSVHDFAPSGSTEAPRMLVGDSPTLGSSELSFVRSLKMVALASTVASTVTFMSDPAMARALVREGLPVPGEVRQLAGMASTVVHAAAESRTRALRSLLAAVDTEPVEDGVIHPAERELSAFLGRHGVASLHEAMFQARANSGRTAALLRLLGRGDGVDATARERLLLAGLEAASVEVRDAAVQAAELWDDAALVTTLRAHKETTPWLADYVARVARDLEG